MKAPVQLQLHPQAADAWVRSLAAAPSDGGACVLLKREEVAALIHDARAARALLDLINTPELVDFPRAVQMEAVHQVQRWGTDDRRGKGPHEWFWLLSHLATRALEHHKESERLLVARSLEEHPCAVNVLDEQIDHHTDKAIHHCITAGAVLSHWHASVLGKATAMRPGDAQFEAVADEMAP